MNASQHYNTTATEAALPGTANATWYVVQWHLTQAFVAGLMPTDSHAAALIVQEGYDVLPSHVCTGWLSLRPGGSQASSTCMAAAER